MFSLLKIGAACPYNYAISVFDKVYNINETLKNCTSKAPLSASKKWK